jgi:hypothetical protein
MKSSLLISYNISSVFSLYRRDSEEGAGEYISGNRLELMVQI